MHVTYAVRLNAMLQFTRCMQGRRPYTTAAVSHRVLAPRGSPTYSQSVGRSVGQSPANSSVATLGVAFKVTTHIRCLQVCKNWMNLHRRPVWAVRRRQTVTRWAKNGQVDTDWLTWRGKYADEEAWFVGLVGAEIGWLPFTENRSPPLNPCVQRPVMYLHFDDEMHGTIL